MMPGFTVNTGGDAGAISANINAFAPYLPTKQNSAVWYKYGGSANVTVVRTSSA